MIQGADSRFTMLVLLQRLAILLLTPLYALAFPLLSPTRYTSLSKLSPLRDYLAASPLEEVICPPSVSVVALPCGVLFCLSLSQPATLNTLNTCTLSYALFGLHLRCTPSAARPRIVRVSRLLKLKLFSPRLFVTPARRSEVRNPEGACNYI